MKLQSILSYIVFAGLLALISCQSKPHPNAEILHSLDSLIFETGTIQQNITDLSKNKVDSIRNIIKETQDSFNEVFTLTDSAAFLVASEYSRIDKPLKNYAKMHESMTEEIHLSLIQIKSLQHDAQYELMEAEDLKKYLSKEIEVSKQVNDKVRLIYTTSISEVNRFDSLQPIMLTTIENLQKD